MTAERKNDESWKKGQRKKTVIGGLTEFEMNLTHVQKCEKRYMQIESKIAS